MLSALQEYVRVKRFTTQKVGDVKQVRVSLFISYKQYTNCCFECTLFGSLTFHENSKALSTCIMVYNIRHILGGSHLTFKLYKQIVDIRLVVYLLFVNTNI